MMTVARTTMNNGTADPGDAASRTVYLHAQMQAGNTVALWAGAAEVAEFPHDEATREHWQNWQVSLGNQAYGSDLEGKQADFRKRIDTLTRKLADLVDVAELGRRIDTTCVGLSATAFLRVELPDRELDIIPWELLALPVASHARGREVCVYRSVRARTRKRSMTPPDPPQRVLLADSAPLSMQSVNFAQEEGAIQAGLKAMEDAGLVHLEPCEDADFLKLAGALNQPTRAVHIAAHGSAARIILREGTEAHELTSKAFAQMLGRQPQPVAAILSVCDSAQGTPRAPGAARAVAETGVAEVLGMYSAITPQAALEFFQNLYEALGRCWSMVSAYAEAVASLRDDTYPNCGFWSVPVLYSRENVIPFPATHGDPQGSYQRIASEVAQLHAVISELRPEESWNENTWRRRTMILRVKADGLREELTELIELVRPEARSGSKWAEDVGRAATVGLRAFDGVVAHATHPGPSHSSVGEFAADKTELAAALEELHEAISARLQFSR